jgi:chemotaxis protein CheZ
VKTLEHIEARVARFATYAGVQDESGHANDKEAEDAARREKLLLNGPSIADEGNTQPDIDRLLASLRGE